MASSVFGPRIRLRRTPEGRRIVVARTVEAPAERAWDLLTDTQRWPDWGPSVSAVECDDRVIRTGSRGRIRTRFGGWLPFAITFYEPYRWTWRVASVPATGHQVDSEGDARCRVAFDVLLWAPFYVPVVVVALRRIARLLESEG